MMWPSYLLEGLEWQEIVFAGLLLGIVCSFAYPKSALHGQFWDGLALCLIVGVIYVLALGEAKSYGAGLIRVEVPWQDREVQVGDLAILSAVIGFTPVALIRRFYRREHGEKDI